MSCKISKYHLSTYFFEKKIKKNIRLKINKNNKKQLKKFKNLNT